jgi:hypothetical protein
VAGAATRLFPFLKTRPYLTKPICRPPPKCVVFAVSRRVIVCLPSLIETDRAHVASDDRRAAKINSDHQNTATTIIVLIIIIVLAIIMPVLIIIVIVIVIVAVGVVVPSACPSPHPSNRATPPKSSPDHGR